jgi:hypothetical protein
MINLDIPRKKEFTWPIWGNQEEMILSVKDITGATAMWAVKQSPYATPKRLEEALIVLGETIAADLEFRELGFTSITIEDLRIYLEKTFEKLHLTLAWNEPEIQTGALLQGSSSRHHTTKPDYDFIGLGALARNIAHTCGMEYFYWK